MSISSNNGNKSKNDKVSISDVYSASGIDSVTDYGEYDEYNGYYDENGQWISSSDTTAQLQSVILDECGRVLDPVKLYEEGPRAVEDIAIFTSCWQTMRISSVLDAQYTSQCVWPDEPKIIKLLRFDLFETDTPSLSQIGSADPTESLKFRRTPNYELVTVFFVMNEPNPVKTFDFYIEQATGPLRNRFRPHNKRNTKDFGSWTIRETLQAFITANGIKGASNFHVDWADSPDRLFRFAAYPASQYYVLRKTVQNEILAAEGGQGYTYIIEKGYSLFARKHWKLLCSFFAFDLELPCSNKYSVYESAVPFQRMNVVIGPMTHPERWTEKFSFYAFDIPVPGTAPLQLQHCVSSIHTTEEGVNRHRLSMDDPRLPWQFRMNVFLFPAKLEECNISQIPPPEDTNYYYDNGYSVTSSVTAGDETGYYDENGEYVYPT